MISFAILSLTPRRRKARCFIDADNMLARSFNIGTLDNPAMLITSPRSS
jgi:uncharacterized protein YfdQ (DUF2303 family)